jgi:hypothetical protein
MSYNRRRDIIQSYVQGTGAATSKAEEMYQDMRVAPQFYWLTRIREALSRLE